MVKNKLTVISTFTGCGGSSLGYKWAGFEELLAIDFDKNAVETFRLNFPEVPIWQRDICSVTAQEILEFCNIKVGELDVLDGSPPCQGFSTAGKRKVNDSRNDLFKEYVRLIKDLQPKVFIMENVSGMIKGIMKGKFNEILLTLKSLNYQVKCKLLNTMWYEVPQSRERLFFIGVRNDLNKQPEFPVPMKSYITVRDILPIIDKHHRGQFDKKKKQTNCPAYTITKTSSMRFIKNGIEVKPSISELKKISSFPDEYKFIGKFQEQWARIGNAVMPKQMYHIARCIKEKILNGEEVL